ncbi:hypothetical protein B6I21_05705 [candidate division KSB1 bacterium 4572_119]|nr:MAG: hypothetical protein B6I21_05705 [candidate division KSB1 bacterium 4572_119]
MITKEQINVIANQIADKIKTNKIYVFGSYAHGKPEVDSDLDLCIITDIGNRRKIELIREIRREIRQYYSVPLDVLVYDNKEFDKRSAHQNTLEYKILNQGVLVYG